MKEEAAKKVYLAWDLPTLDKAIPVLEATKGLLYNVKINSLFTKEGPGVINTLRDDYGMSMFLDLKFYDIPGTVYNHVKAAAMHDIDMLTVHTHGGVPMMEQAVKGVIDAVEEAGVKRPKIVGVTVLTSFKQNDYLRTLNRKQATPDLIGNQVINLAGLAKEAGLDGIVCSSKEVGTIKEAYPDLITVVPGIKHPKTGVAGSTQNLDRVATPSNAIKWGADYLVIGSAIHKASDPRQSMLDIIEDIAGVIK